MGSIASLRGRTITEISGDFNSDRITFELDNGEKYIMEHYQDCCESVKIHDIYGYLRGLIGQTVEDAYMSSENLPQASESGTLTRFTIRTPNDLVIITWHGYSNGYYSEGVSFYKDGANRWDDEDEG